MLDDVDRRILRQFQGDPMLSTAELAALCGVSSGVCWRRLEKMREAGVLRGVRAVIDWGALGYGVEVSLRITLDKAQPRAFEAVTQAARQIPEVIEIQTFLDRVDLRLSVIARDMAHYQAIYRDHILTLPGIADIEALMHIARIKSDESLPV